MKLCHICLSSDKLWTLDGSNIYATTDTVMYLCDGCYASMKKQFSTGLHVPTALWIIKRIRKQLTRKFKVDIERKEREIEALIRLGQRQAKELNELKGNE